MGSTGNLTLSTLLYNTNMLKHDCSINLLLYPLFAMKYLYILSFKSFQPTLKKKWLRGQKVLRLTKGLPVAPGIIVGDVQVCRRNQFGTVPVELSLPQKKKTQSTLKSSRHSKPHTLWCNTHFNALIAYLLISAFFHFVPPVNKQNPL